MRLPVSILLIGGGLLVVLSQLIFAQIPEPFLPIIFLLMAIGLIAFALGGRLVARPQPPPMLVRPVANLAGRLQITPARLLLLLFAPCFALLAVLAAGDTLQAVNVPVYLLAWFLSIACVLVGASSSLQDVEAEIDKKELLLVAALFLFAFALRVWAIDTVPATLSGDEGSAGLASVSFVNGEADNILTVGWFLSHHSILPFKAWGYYC